MCLNVTKGGVNAWGQVAKLTAGNDATLGSSFGAYVAIENDTVIVGAPDGVTDFQSRKPGPGAVYIFERNQDGNNTWGQADKLAANDGQADDFFGISVALSADTLLIGADGVDDKGENSGAAYVFKRTQGVWNQVAKLTADDGAAGEFFGLSVDVSGSTVIVSADYDDARQGAVYFFNERRRLGTTTDSWQQVAKLQANDGMAGDQFGISVGISGDTAIVGAYRDSDQGVDSGSAYVLTHECGTWKQMAKLKANDGGASFFFGEVVNIAGKMIVVGAPGSRITATDPSILPGSAYLFEGSGNTNEIICDKSE